MQSILSKALQDELSATPDLTAVFELGGQKIPVGAKPLSPADFAAVNKGLPVSLQTDPTQFQGQINMLIRKTRLLTAEGDLSDDKALSVKDRPILERMDVSKVSGMFYDLFGPQLSDDLYDEDGDGPKDEVDEAKGNS